jgi:hypothetical protein
MRLEGANSVLDLTRCCLQMSTKIFAELGAVMGVAEQFSTLAGRVQRVAEVQEVRRY